MDKKIEITAVQFKAADDLNDAQIDKSGSSPFVVSRKTERGEAYTTKDGRKLFKTVEKYSLLIADYDETRQRYQDALSKRAAGEAVFGKGSFWLQMHDIVPFID